MVQGGADAQAFLERLALFKARGGVQLEGARYAAGDFSFCLARAVQARAPEWMRECCCYWGGPLGAAIAVAGAVAGPPLPSRRR